MYLHFIVALELYRRRKLFVNAGTGKSTTFLIRPSVLGYISIKLVANSRIAGDALERKLLVKVTNINMNT